MKKRLIITLSLLVLILCLFFAFNILSSNSQETEAKKEFGQTQVKKTKSKKETTANSEEKASVNKSETSKTSEQNSSPTAPTNSQESNPQINNSTNGTENEKTSSSQELLTSLQKRDFSPIAGTWKNNLGEILIIAADGSFTLDYKHSDGSIKRGQDKIGSGFIQDDCYQANITGAAIKVTPAGVKNIHMGTVYDQDSITMGQSIEADNHPFFKQ